MNLTTTIKTIYSHAPCREGFAKLLFSITRDPFFENCGLIITEQYSHLTEEQRNQPVTLLQILNSNGPKDAYWALRCWPYSDYCLLNADVISDCVTGHGCAAVRNMPETIRLWHRGAISDADLEVEAEAARAAARSAWVTAEATAAVAKAVAAAETVETSWAEAARAAARSAWMTAASAAARAAEVEAEAWDRNERLMREFCAETETK